MTDIKVAGMVARGKAILILFYQRIFGEGCKKMETEPFKDV
jgi:hypothetical protein